MSARLLLNKLAERGFVKLPPRRPGGGRQILRALSEPELFSLSAGGGELIEGPLRALQPLEVIPVEPRTTQANAFVWHLGQHHYLGYGGAAGQNLRYLIRDCFGRDLACLLFGAAAWKVKARDAFIGWSAEQRQERLSLIVNNSRFLILPHVRVPHLASHILGTILRRLRGDWQRKYHLAPCLAETFVECERFAGVCYRAANWLQAAQRAEHRQAAPFRVEPQKRAVAPKRPGRKRGHPGAFRHKPDHLDEEIEVQLCSCPHCGGTQFK